MGSCCVQPAGRDGPSTLHRTRAMRPLRNAAEREPASRDGPEMPLRYSKGSHRPVNRTPASPYRRHVDYEVPASPRGAVGSRAVARLLEFAHEPSDGLPRVFDTSGSQPTRCVKSHTATHANLSSIDMRAICSGWGSHRLKGRGDGQLSFWVVGEEFAASAPDAPLRWLASRD